VAATPDDVIVLPGHPHVVALATTRTLRHRPFADCCDTAVWCGPTRSVWRAWPAAAVRSGWSVGAWVGI